MSIKKVLGTLAITTALGGLFATTIHSTQCTSNLEQQNNVISNQATAKSRLNESTEVEVDGDDFCIKTRSATSTPKAKSYEFSFSSVQVSTYGNATKSFWIAIDDESFSGNPTDYANTSGTNNVPPTFSGVVYAIEAGTSGGSITIPTTFKYGSKFVVSVKTIEFDVVLDYAGITDIYIPSGIELVEAEAFVDAPSTVNFHCEANSRPEGWSENWLTGEAQVQWGETITEKNKTASYAAGGDKKFGDAKNYIVGSEAHPLILSFDSTLNGNTVTRSMTLGLNSNLNSFDAVGSLFGMNTFTRTVDIEVEEGETIDPESFVFHNIYSAKLTEDGKKLEKDSNNNPIPDVAYYCVSAKTYTHEVNLSEIITFRFARISTFGDYTSVAMYVDLVTPSPYPELMPTVYENNISTINSGKYRIRYAFYGLTSASYNIVYNNANGEKVTKVLKVVTPIATFELKKTTNNYISFLIKNSDVGEDFEPKNLTEFDLIGASINIHLWDTENNNKLGRSEYNKRFGHITVMSKNDTNTVFSCDSFLVIFFAVYTVVYAIAATGLYFYRKEKYKNDEFKRMKTKQYVSKALISFGGLGIILLASVSIVLRSTVMKTSVVTYNPTDIFIVLAGLASLIIIGYFVKYVVALSKANKHRKAVAKLHLDKDVADDGTK